MRNFFKWPFQKQKSPHEKVQWKKDTITWSNTDMWGPEGRGLEFYKRDFELDTADMAGKRVCNMGSGLTVRFEKEVLETMLTNISRLLNFGL